MEMWNGKRYDLDEVEMLGFERVAVRDEFRDIQGLDQFDKVLMFEFKNDIRSQMTYVLRDNVRYKVDDPNDLYDLKAAFREAINFPNDFNPLAHSVYQKIMQVNENNFENIREFVKSIVSNDSLLMNDHIIRNFINNQSHDFYKEVKRKTALALRNYNFDIDILPQIMADLREIKTKDEVDLLKKAVAISVAGQIEVMKAMHPDMGEREIQGIHEFVYRKYGADEGYPSIVGAGKMVVYYTILKMTKRKLIINWF